MSKVRIVSDGDGTAEITDAETGALIPGVTAITVEMRPGQANIARIETQRAMIDVVANRRGFIPTATDTGATDSVTIFQMGPDKYRVAKDEWGGFILRDGDEWYIDGGIGYSGVFPSVFAALEYLMTNRAKE